MKCHHYCKKCDIDYCFLIEVDAVTKEEKEMSEEYGSDGKMLRAPENEKEIKQASWQLSDDGVTFSEIPADKEELNEYDFCDNCKHFIKNKWKL
jgi:hypothetical protein